MLWPSAAGQGFRAKRVSVRSTAADRRRSSMIRSNVLGSNREPAWCPARRGNRCRGGAGGRVSECSPAALLAGLRAVQRLAIAESGRSRDGRADSGDRATAGGRGVGRVPRISGSWCTCCGGWPRCWSAGCCGGWRIATGTERHDDGPAGASNRCRRSTSTLSEAAEELDEVLARGVAAQRDRRLLGAPGGRRGGSGHSSPSERNVGGDDHPSAELPSRRRGRHRIVRRALSGGKVLDARPHRAASRTGPAGPGGAPWTAARRASSREPTL